MITPNGGVFGRNPKFNNVTVDGNLTVNGDIALGDDITVTDTLTVNGITTVANATESTGSGNGALVVSGGVGIAKRLNVAGNAAVTSGTASSSTTTGALVVTGGCGVSGAVNAGANSTFNQVSVGRGSASGSSNVVVGSGLASTSSSASQNVGLGVAVFSDASFAGAANTCIGHVRGFAMTGSSNFNTLIGGASSFPASHTASLNTFVGYECGHRNYGSNTAGVGASALAVNAFGQRNTATGYVSLSAATTAIASVTTTVAGSGGSDGPKTSIQLERDSGGVMLTYPTVDLTVTGGAVSGTVDIVTGGTAPSTFASGSIVFKANAAGIAAGVPADWRCELTSTANATDNTAVGFESQRLMRTGTHNTCVGSTALDALVSGSRNSAVGFDSLGAATGSDNTALGSDSGDGISTGSQNTCIGSNADTAAGGDSNSTVIGYNAVGDGSNTVVIGNSSVTSHKLHGTATSAAIISGDTLRIVTRKAPASNAAGTAGDICVGTDGGVTYLYFCIANNNWGRVAFTTGY